MNSFGYLCPVCNKTIIGGELSQLTHIRHGKVLGTTTGHYNGCDGVVEDDYFGGISGRNSNQEILRSEFEFKDSHCLGERKQTPSGREVRIYPPFIDLALCSPERECFELAIEDIDKDLQEHAQAILALEDELHQSVDQDLSSVSANYYEKTMTLSDMRSDSNPYWTVLYKLYNEYISNLPDSREAKSGVIAVHVSCLNTLSKEEQASLPFSKPDLGIKEEY